MSAIWFSMWPLGHFLKLFYPSKDVISLVSKIWFSSTEKFILSRGSWMVLSTFWRRWSERRWCTLYTLLGTFKTCWLCKTPEDEDPEVRFGFAFSLVDPFLSYDDSCLNTESYEFFSSSTFMCSRAISAGLILICLLFIRYERSLSPPDFISYYGLFIGGQELIINWFISNSSCLKNS